MTSYTIVHFLNLKISAYSRSWAQQLAKERRLHLSPTTEYGENLYTENYITGLQYPSRIVHHWYKEVQYYESKMSFKDLHLISE